MGKTKNIDFRKYIGQIFKIDSIPAEIAEIYEAEIWQMECILIGENEEWAVVALVENVETHEVGFLSLEQVHQYEKMSAKRVKELAMT